MTEVQLDCALDLMRRLPPTRIEENLAGLIDLVPSLCEDLLSSVDQPLKIAKDANQQEYLLCDYNRDGDSYRSPWSNEYDPPFEDEGDDYTGAFPSEKTRELEIQANAAFDQYREMYFEGGVSSVYLWDLEDSGGFAGCFLVKKVGDGSKKIKGCWDSIHVVEVQDKGRSATYKLTSTIMLWLETNKADSGKMKLGGSLTRQDESDRNITPSTPHIANIGMMIEAMENKMRNTLNEIYFGKTKDICNDLRSLESLGGEADKRALQMDLASALMNRNKKAASTDA